MDVLELLKPGSELLKILDSLYDGVYIVTPHRKILYWNKAAEEMTGFLKEEVLGKSCGDNILNHIDENGILLCRSNCPILKAIREDKNISAKVYPKSKSGKRFPVETHISPLYNEAGEVIAAIEVFRDITHQEELRILQEKFQTMIKRYVSETTFQEVRERISANSNSGAPRVLDMTVLYLDMVSFTAFSERHKPEEVVKLLNELFGVCEVITRECLGDIDKFIGDAIMAVFSDANDAILAALKILNTGIPELNRVRLENGEEEIAVRIGINSGLVLQGDIGALERKDLTVIGDTVNIAARLEKAALPNRLMISEATLARLEPQNYLKFQYHNSLDLKGKTEQIKAYLNISH